jgi:hypothetical protein
MGILGKISAKSVAVARSVASSGLKLGALGAGVGLVGAGVASLYGTGAGPDPYRTGTNGDSVWFPNDLDMNDNYIQFIAKSTEGALSNTISGATIRLPLPAGLSTDYHPQYSTPDLGAGAAGNAIKAFDRGIYGNTDIAAGAAAGGTLAGAGLTAVGAAVKGVLGDTGALGAAALKVGAGLAQNPNKIVLFTGVDFRDHSFSWKLTPRNRAESNSIRTIIEMFTYYSHPDFFLGGLYFKYPEYFEIAFKRDDYLFKLRPSVCNGIKVDYHPQSYASYVRNADGTGAPAPTEVTLSMQFKEVEIINKSYLNQSQREPEKVLSDISQNSLLPNGNFASPYNPNGT